MNAGDQIRAEEAMVVSHDSWYGDCSLPVLEAGAKYLIQDGCMTPGRLLTVVEQYSGQVGISNGHRILLQNRQHVRDFYAL